MVKEAVVRFASWFFGERLVGNGCDRDRHKPEDSIVFSRSESWCCHDHDRFCDDQKQENRCHEHRIGLYHKGGHGVKRGLDMDV